MLALPVGFQSAQSATKGSVAKFRISVVLAGVSSQTPQVPVTKSGLKSWSLSGGRNTLTTALNRTTVSLKKLPVRSALQMLNSASATLAGIEVAHMIWKGQLDQSEQSDFAQFAALAG